MNFEIVLLAMVAAFLGLRLYSALGKRTGHEHEPVLDNGSEEAKHPGSTISVLDNERPKPAPAAEKPPLDGPAQRGLRDIAAADRNFDLVGFVEGARGAYGMILNAFWTGDREELAELCDDDVFAAFSKEIDGRNKRGEILKNRLVRIDMCRVLDAELVGTLARITVRFEADISTLVVDANGDPIAGSMTDAEHMIDLWTFKRDLRAADRNWVLDETDQD